MSDQGWIFLGKSHADCFYQMRNVGVQSPKGSFNQGFVTNFGRFVPRNRALDIAVEAGQCERIGDSLISEMLWHKNDNGKFSYDSVFGYFEAEKENTNQLEKLHQDLAAAKELVGS